jgi:prevent-host-death family protein
MEITNIHEAKTHLSRLINRAVAGEEVIIGRAGEPLVKLVPYRPQAGARQGGQWHGRVWVAEDFDAPDPELERLFYGEVP